MKLEVNNYIYNKFHERGMKAFENKVAKILRSKGITQGKFICLNSYIVRGNGYGSYLKRIEFSFGGTNSQTYTEHTNDSMLWDDWENPTAKEKRNLFLTVLKSVEFDLFSYWYMLPKKAIKAIDIFNENEDADTLLSELNSLGYTCEIGSDGMPYNLKKL